MAETIYFNGFSAKKSKYGIKLSGKVEKIIEELQKHVNSKGYINLDVTERREADKYGNTHTVKVDTWQPTPKDGVTESTGVPISERGKKQEEFKVEDENDTLPF